MKLISRIPPLLAGFGLLGFILAFKQISDLDIWWHLSAGRWMLENGEVVRQDPFSFTARGEPWTSITWGYEVLIYLLYQVGGPVAVTAGHAIAAAGAMIFSWWTFLRLSPTRAQSEKVLGAAIFLAGIFLVEWRWNHRPEMFTHLFGAAMLFIFLEERRAPTRLIWLIPVIQVLWVNTHGLFIFGPIVAGLFLGARLLEQPNRKEEHIRLLAVFALTAIACFLNPRGAHGAFFPLHLFKILNHVFYQRTIPEATNPLRDAVWGFDTWGFVLWTLSALAAFFWLRPFRASERYSWAYFPLLLGLVWVSVSARRNIALLVIWTLPFVADSLAQAVDPFLRRSAAWLRAEAKTEAWIIGAVAVLAFLFATDLGRPKNSVVRFGGAVAPAYYGEGAVEFLKANGLAGKTFSNVEFADYALFAWPDFRPYIDGRFAELYTQLHFQRYMDVLAHPHLFDIDAKEKGIEVVAVAHRGPMIKGLVVYLSQHPGWKVAYYDEAAVIFVPKSSKLAEQDPRAAFESLAKRYPRGLRRFGTRFRKYDLVRPMVQLSEIASLIGQIDLAKVSIDEALARNGSYGPAWGSFCRVMYLKIESDAAKAKKGEVNPEMVGQAEQACQRALKLDPDPISSHQILGLIWMNTGRPAEAARAFEKVLKVDPISYEAHLMRAQAYSRLGDTRNLDKVVASYSEAARLRPYDAKPLIHLGMLFGQFGRKDEALQVFYRARQLGKDPFVEERIKELEKGPAPRKK